MLILPRRRLLLAAASFLAAPAIVRAGTLSLLGVGKPAAAAAGVLFDASGIVTGIATGASATPINVGSGSNGTTHRALVVYLTSNTGSPGAPSGVTWNGVAMTIIGNDGIDNGTMWGLVNPATGSNAIVPTFAGGGTFTVAALSVVGADQTGGATTFHGYTVNSNSTADCAVTIPSANGEIVFGGFQSTATATTFTSPDAGCTDIGKIATGTLPAAAAWIASVGASATVGYTMIGAAFNVPQGCSIKAG